MSLLWLRIVRPRMIRPPEPVPTPMMMVKCGLLGENQAHPTFYENRDKTRIGISMFNCVAMKKLKQTVAWVPELWSEKHHGCGTQLFEKT